MNSIIVNGRRWVDKKYGNTYCSGTVIIDGKVKLYIPFQYGSENHYKEAALEVLEKERVITDRVRKQSLKEYCSERNIILHMEVCDVVRKKDL